MIACLNVQAEVPQKVQRLAILDLQQAAQDVRNLLQINHGVNLVLIKKIKVNKK
jgi:hypothetical protein